MNNILREYRSIVFFGISFLILTWSFEVTSACLSGFFNTDGSCRILSTTQPSTSVGSSVSGTACKSGFFNADGSCRVLGTGSKTTVTRRPACSSGFYNTDGSCRVFNSTQPKSRPTCPIFNRPLCPKGKLVSRGLDGNGCDLGYECLVSSDTDVCTTEYRPVCGQPRFDCPAGAYCIQALPEPKTYSNLCRMRADSATFLNEGVCQNENQVKPGRQLGACDSGFFNADGSCRVLGSGSGTVVTRRPECSSGFYNPDGSCREFGNQTKTRTQLSSCDSGFYNSDGSCRVFNTNSTRTSYGLCASGFYNTDGSCRAVQTQTRGPSTTYTTTHYQQIPTSSYVPTTTYTNTYSLPPQTQYTYTSTPQYINVGDYDNYINRLGGSYTNTTPQYQHVGSYDNYINNLSNNYTNTSSTSGNYWNWFNY